MSVTHPSPYITCDCKCESCPEGSCQWTPEETVDDGESIYAVDPGWANVDDSPGDGEGEHYCAPCAAVLGIDEEFIVT